jgi:CheY-like chemotaxis protein
MSLEQRRIECVDSLRITPREETEIISELSQSGAVPGTSVSSKERRQNGRVPYLNQSGLFVQMKHPGGSVVNYLVRTRNLSPTGIAFLHGSFVYTGTACVLALHDKDGKMVGIDGKVVRCQHVRGHVHDIGVRFARPLELKQFLIRGESKGQTSSPSAGAGQTSEELPRFAGTVLCAEENASDTELLKFYLESLGLGVTVVSSGLEALDYLEGKKFDVLIVAVSLPGMSGPDLAEAARGAGFTSPIIALSADDRCETKVEALARGCTDLLAKPYTAEQLVRLLAAHLPRAAATGSGPAEVKPLASEMWGNTKMRPLIRKFVARLFADVREIQRLTFGATAAPTASPDLVGKLCMGLKGSAGSFGYPTISKVAQRLTELVLTDAAGASERQIKDAVAELVRLTAAANAFIEIGKESGKAPAGPPTPGAAA